MLNKLTKQIGRFILGAFIIGSALQSCAVLNNNPKNPEYIVDLVCGMKVDKSEAYTYKYNGNKYYFDNYNCKEAFKMNPENFLKNKCAETK